MKHVEEIIGMLFTAALIGAAVYLFVAGKRAECRQSFYDAKTHVDSSAVVAKDKWCAP